MTRSTTVRVLPLLLGVFFLSVYLLSGSSDLNHNGDTDLRYQTTQAMVDHHRLWIAQPMWMDTRVARGLGGHLYAFYAPGQATFMAPLYVAGRAIAHHLSLPYDITTLYTSRSLDLILGALLAVLFFLVARSLDYSPRVSVALTLIFGLATVAWPDAQSALEQTQVDLFLLLSVFAAWQFVRLGMERRKWLWLAGTAIGLGIFTRYDAVLYLPLVALYPAVLRWHRGHVKRVVGDWLIFGLGVVPWVGLVALWNVARFGSPFLTGLHESTFGEPFWSGFLGLTVSPGKGLIWYLPLVFLLPWAVPRFYRRHHSLTWLFGVLVLVSLLFYSNVLYWHGDPAWGPRYLYTTIPYLVLPLGELLAAWGRLGKKLQVFAVLVVGASFVLQVAAVSVTQWRYWYRLEAMQEHTAQPFNWGATKYHYYWNLRESPIPIQIDNLYQIIRLDALGDQRYLLTARPTVCTPTRCLSNPVDNYPVNTLSFWWADVRHPLLGQHTRLAIASLLGLFALLSAALILIVLRRVDSVAEEVHAGVTQSMPGAGSRSSVTLARPSNTARPGEG